MASPNHVALVTGADHGLGLALTKELLDRGWDVAAGRYGTAPSVPAEHSIDSIGGAYGERLAVVPLDVSDMESVSEAALLVGRRFGRVDLVINNAGVLGREGLERHIADGLPYDEMFQTISVNAFGPLRVVEALLPLLEESQFRRLCFVSSEAGSISRCYRTAWYGYGISKAALNMGVATLFNDLRPKGYTFRVYHPGWMQTFMSGTHNVKATLTPDEAAAAALRAFLDADVDEDRLVLRDYRGNEWPW